MKVVKYHYSEKGHQRCLYVDKDFVSSSFPAWAKKVITKKRARICREPIRLTVNEVELFKRNGYLLAPDVIFTEFEGV